MKNWDQLLIAGRFGDLRFRPGANVQKVGRTRLGVIGSGTPGVAVASASKPTRGNGSAVTPPYWVNNLVQIFAIRIDRPVKVVETLGIAISERKPVGES